MSLRDSNILLIKKFNRDAGYCVAVVAVVLVEEGSPERANGLLILVSSPSLTLTKALLSPKIGAA